MDGGRGEKGVEGWAKGWSESRRGVEGWSEGRRDWRAGGVAGWFVFKTAGLIPTMFFLVLEKSTLNPCCHGPKGPHKHRDPTT